MRRATLLVVGLALAAAVPQASTAARYAVGLRTGADATKLRDALQRRGLGLPHPEEGRISNYTHMRVAESLQSLWPNEPNART